MPIRLLLAAALALAAARTPRGRAGGELCAGRGDREVPRRYGGEHRASGSSRLAGTDTERALPGGSEQLAIEDGESVRETVAELRDDPNVAYAVPNYRAHASALPNDPGLVEAVELPRQLRDRDGGGVGDRDPARRARRSRGAGGAAGQRGGLRAPRPLPAGARPAALDLREGLRLRGARQASQRRVRARHPRGGHDRAVHEQRARDRRASPTAPGSCPCGCSTGRAPATRSRSRGRSATPPATAPT